MEDKFYLATLKHFTSVYESIVIPVGLFTTPEEARASLLKRIKSFGHYKLREVDKRDLNHILFYTYDTIDNANKTFLGVVTELQLGAICTQPHAF